MSRGRQLLGLLVLAGMPALAQPARGVPEDFQAALWGASCMSCHGTDGRAEGTGLSIAGRPADELYALLVAYKRGSRPATIMHQHARGYTDAELRRIALYFSRIQ